MRRNSNTINHHINPGRRNIQLAIIS